MPLAMPFETPRETLRLLTTEMRPGELIIMDELDLNDPADVRSDAHYRLRLGIGTRLATHLGWRLPTPIPADRPLLYSKLKIDLPEELNTVGPSTPERHVGTQMFAELNSAVQLFKRTVSQMASYEFLESRHAGITLNSAYPGTIDVAGYQGVFVNHYHFTTFHTLKSPAAVAGAILHTLHHETVRSRLEEHSGLEIVELSRLAGRMHDNGTHDRHFKALHTVVDRHWDTYCLGSAIYESGEGLEKNPTFYMDFVREEAATDHFNSRIRIPKAQNTDATSTLRARQAEDTATAMVASPTESLHAHAEARRRGRVYFGHAKSYEARSANAPPKTRDANLDR
jgi:hypothetical protein